MDSQVKTWEELLDEYSLRDIYKEEYEKLSSYVKGGGNPLQGKLLAEVRFNVVMDS